MRETPVSGPCTAPEQAAVADLWPHPLTAEGRETRRVALRGHETLASLAAQEARRLGADPGHVAIALNGCPVARALWPAARLGPGDIVTLRVVPAGGDSNALAIALQIAIIAGAAYIGGPAGVALLGSQFAASAASAAVLIGGTLVANALVPPPSPDAPGGGAPGEAVYSLAGGANRARLYARLPLVLGTHRMFPDLGAREYAEFAAGADGRVEQGLFQIFNFGFGNLEIRDLRHGDTPLSVYEGVETEWARGGGTISLVAGNVDTVEGAALDATDWIERVLPAGTARAAIDIAGQLFTLSKKGDPGRRAVEIEIEHWPEGGDVGKVALRRTLAWDKRTPYRRTIALTLTNAGADKAHHVRLRRLRAPEDSKYVIDRLHWTALRGYQPDSADYSGQTRLGLKFRASGQVSGRLEKISAMVSQRVPVWDGRRWSAPRVTSNPAWIYRWFARGVFVDGQLKAGAGLPPARVDDAALKRWGAWCEAQGLACDYAIDRAMTQAQVLTLIARCGRASPSWAAGKLGVVWEAAGTPVTALITPENILAGSLEVDWAAATGAEEIVCRYVEPDLDWQWNSVRRLAPGVRGAPARSVTVTLPGVTKRAQAATECNLQAARQIYHRRRIAWDMADEGLLIQRGDVVRLTHGLIDGGLAGRLLGGNERRLRLSRPVELTGEDYIILRLADGALHTTLVARPGGGGDDEVLLAAPLPAAPGAAGDDPLDILWRLYPAGSPPAKVRIVSVRPRADGTTRFEAIDEVDAYHRAATSDLAVPLPRLRRETPRVLAIGFSEAPVQVGRAHLVEITATLSVAGDWRGGTIRADDGGEMRVVARLSAGETSASWIARAGGEIDVVVTPGSDAAPAGTPFVAKFKAAGVAGPAPAAPEAFTVAAAADGTRRFGWRDAASPTVVGYRILYAPGARDPRSAMTPLHDGLLTASPWESQDPPAGTWRFAIVAVDAHGRESEPAYAAATLPPPRGAARSTEYIFRRTAGATAPARPTGDRVVDSYLPYGWSRDPRGVTVDLPSEWVSSRQGRAGAWGNFSTPALFSRYSRDGKDGNPGKDGEDGEDGASGKRARGDFYRRALRAAWSGAEARLALPGAPIVSDTVTLYYPSGSWAETRAWSGRAWLRIDKRLDGNILMPGSVTANAIAANSITSSHIRAGSIVVGSQGIRDGAVGSEKLSGVIQSSNFRTGKSGWRIQKSGDAEFNGVVISRKIVADQGSLPIPRWGVKHSAAIRLAGTWFVERTGVPISAWNGTDATYLGTGGITNAHVISNPGVPPDVLWGVQVTVLPLTRWSGGQTLRLKLDLWCKGVTDIRPVRGGRWWINWKIYRVS